MRTLRSLGVAALCLSLTTPLFAQAFKPPSSELDRLTFAKRELRVTQTFADADQLGRALPNRAAIDAFRKQYGAKWRFLFDRRTGHVNLIDGGAIPFLSGTAKQMPRERVIELARDFVSRHAALLQVKPDELQVDAAGTMPVGNSIYHVRFQWMRGNVPIEGGSITLSINNGNLIQIGSQNIAPIEESPQPQVPAERAWDAVWKHVGGRKAGDRVVNPGTLSILPMTPKGMDPDSREVPFGKMMDYALVWKLAFKREGVIGTWEGTVDAHTGELLRFRDSNAYGHIQGGVYKTDAPLVEVSAPFGKADYGSGLFANALGDFPSVAGTSTMTGLNMGSAGVAGGVQINDICGSISRAANGVGLIDFGSSGGTDCTTPGFGGAGNTHAARTQYWNVTEIKNKAITFLPSNTWLQGPLIDIVNINAACNAYWDNTVGSFDVNFYRTGTSPFFGPFTQTCGNTGELPGISLHEWGHGMDQLDGSSMIAFPDNIPIETRADWTATLQTHSSCTGAGFATARVPLPAYGLNCVGYGNPCTGCTGIRNMDFAANTDTTPWTPQNQGTVFMCSGGGYTGPCGWEDHCESGIASQALWDLVNRDLVGPPTSLDLTTAWQLADRLTYAGAPSSTSMYTCTTGGMVTSNGCGAGSLYTVMRMIDDDGDGVANGTPHGAAIFAALNRHGIACGVAGDATNQNQTSCPALTTPTVTATANNNSVTVNWTTGGASATRYFVFRNETTCGSGFTLIATVAAPTLTYTDTAVVTGATYNYRVQAATANDSCVSAMSNCVSATAALPDDQDFYVRDWTSSMVLFDDGAQPSTNGVFWYSSDVWNRGTNTPGAPNASGWFPTDNFFVGAGALGDNWGFARVHRNSIGSAESVNVHFLISPFGTGSPFQHAAATPDPSIPFAAGDTVQTMTMGYLIHQDDIMSTHACIAVEISTANDPIAPPNLVGNTPGPADYIVINDNNKAQRNLDVSRNVAHLGGSGFALINNSASYMRDVVLQYESPDVKELRDTTIEIIGGERMPFRSGGRVVLPGMEPGEKRWIALRHNAPGNDPIPVHFRELEGERPVNGFTFLATPVTVREAIPKNVRDHYSVFVRYAAAFGEGKDLANRTRPLIGKEVSESQYLRLLREQLNGMSKLAGAVTKRNGGKDPFGVTASIERLTAATKQNKADAAAAEHGMLLNALDAFATMLIKADGDAADIPQMVRWQEALYRTRPELQRNPCSEKVVKASQEFLRYYDSRKPESYRELLANVSDCLAQTGGKPPSSDMPVARLQKAHREYLIELQKKSGSVQP